MIFSNLFNKSVVITLKKINYNFGYVIFTLGLNKIFKHTQIKNVIYLTIKVLKYITKVF